MLLPYLIISLPLIAAARDQYHLVAPPPGAEYNLVSHALVRGIDELRQDWGIHGAAIAVVRRGDDGTWKEDAFGVGVADGWGNKVTENVSHPAMISLSFLELTPSTRQTLFDIASNSKLFTAIATGLIIANETTARGTKARLTLRTKIKDVVPDWKLMDPIASEGTDVVDLLCESACREKSLEADTASQRIGLGYRGTTGSTGTSIRTSRCWDDVLTRLASSIAEDKRTLISRLRHLRPSTEFRQSWQYNNLAYVVASSFPEYLYHIPYTTYVQDNIFSPLGMNDTTYDLDKASRNGRRSDSWMRRGMNVSASVHDLERNEFGKACQGEVVNIGWMKETTRDAGAGGVITSAKDMVSL